LEPNLLELNEREVTMERTNKLKRTLSEGKVAIGTLMMSFSPAVAEVAGFSGLDYVRFEGEHSWRKDESMEHMIRAARLSDTTPLLRIDNNDPFIIRKALEIGLGGIVVADISSKEDAEKAVIAAKFPPRGRRGYSNVCFSGQWGALGAEDFIAGSNHETLVGIMVENEEVVSQLPEIAAIDGVDFFLFGAADYSLSLGFRKPQKDDPKVQDAIKKTIDAAAKHNKPVGINIGQDWEAEARKYIKLGCRMIEIGQDVGVLRSVWKSTSTNIRKIQP
jgi:4-hydroxy-2-oxoheptanedioate aldolase